MKSERGKESVSVGLCIYMYLRLQNLSKSTEIYVLTDLQTRMEADIWAGFGVEFVVTIGLVFWVLKKTTVPSWLKANGKKTPTPVCKSEVCAKLNDCMVRYMKKHLAFEDETEELEEVKKQLKDQLHIHNTDEMTGGSYISLKHIKKKRKEGRQVMMQCIRTTLVAHPDDIRGRRRANMARQILINHVYE